MIYILHEVKQISKEWERVNLRLLNTLKIHEMKQTQVYRNPNMQAQVINLLLSSYLK